MENLSADPKLVESKSVSADFIAVDEKQDSVVVSSPSLPDLPHVESPAFPSPAFTPFIPVSSASVGSQSESPTTMTESDPLIIPTTELPITKPDEAVSAVVEQPHIEPVAEPTEQPVATPTLEIIPTEEPRDGCETFINKIHAIYEKLKKDPDSIAFMKVNPTFMQIFGILLEKNPIIFKEFEQKIKIILEDGKLSVKDIPHMIKLLKQVYSAIKSLNLKSISGEVYGQLAIDVVYSIFVISVNQGLIQLNQPKESIAQFLLILESCRDLIDITVEYKKWWMMCGC